MQVTFVLIKQSEFFVKSNVCFSLVTAIRFGRMPEAEKKKLVAGLLAGEATVQNPQIADLKSLAKHVYNAYLKNFIMTKKKARDILSGKATKDPVSKWRESRWS